jgi:DNA-binding MarR family transcriptional regulator
MAAIIRQLGVSKQAAGQLVDALVVRGYLERKVDADDRRRLTLVLTERGRAAAQVARHAIDRIDMDLAHRVGPHKLAHAREVLMAVLETKHEH